jgi:CyaY protein
MLTEGTGMDESEFNALAERELAGIEMAIESCGAGIDAEMKPGGVLELEFESGAKIIINRHSIAKEIWVAARSGGFHFRPVDGQWIAARDGSELYSVLSSLVGDQLGRMVEIRPVR